MSMHKRDDLASIIYNVPFHIFGITETWMHPAIATEEVNIPGYTIHRLERSNIKSYKTRGGGLLLYVMDTYNVDIITTHN